eukprot:COSAG06_NODE_577_length_14043_cov_5.505952_10_plen_65_part_00
MRMGWQQKCITYEPLHTSQKGHTRERARHGLVNRCRWPKRQIRAAQGREHQQHVSTAMLLQVAS